MVPKKKKGEKVGEGEIGCDARKKMCLALIR